MFSIVSILLINKIDTIEYFDFDPDVVRERAKKLNPGIRVIPISAKTGKGIDEWADWIRTEVKNWTIRNIKFWSPLLRKQWLKRGSA